MVPGVARPREATHLRGVTLPGLANAHSHAFQRALRGRTQRGGGSFWTWREDMYALAGSLTPDDTYRARAAAPTREMLRAGITCVGEFDYVHHSEALIAAADEVGIRLTLLDACYLAGGFGEPPNAVAGALQRRRRGALGRARVGDQGRAGRRRDPLRPRGARRAARHGRRVGARASRCTSTSPSSAPRTRPAWPPTASRRSSCSREHGALGPRSTAVHATHLTDADRELLQRDHDLHVPDDRARPRGRHRPPRREPQPSAATATRSSTSSRRPAPSSSTCASPPSAAATSRRRRCCEGATNHASLGWPEAGRLEPGALADFITVGLDSPRLETAEPETLLESLVFAATAADVHTVVDRGTQR